MARFRASIMPVHHNNVKVTRLGHSTMEVRLDGWDSGIKVTAWIDSQGNDCFTIESTGGSNKPSNIHLITCLVDGKENK